MFYPKRCMEKKDLFRTLKKTKKHMLNELILHQTNKRKEKLRTTNFFLFLNHSKSKNIDQQGILRRASAYLIYCNIGLWNLFLFTKYR